MGHFCKENCINIFGNLPIRSHCKQRRFSFQIADAPSVAVNRVDTYKELDNDVLKHVAYATLDDIDLRLLTRCMAPEQALKEPGLLPL